MKCLIFCIIYFVCIISRYKSELISYETFIKLKQLNAYNGVADYAKLYGYKNFDNYFNKFKQKYGKQYESKQIEEKRAFNLFKSLLHIRRHNKAYNNGDVTHKLDVNHLADLSQSEYNETLNSAQMPLNRTQPTPPELIFYDSLPDSFDWRDQNKVTPVTNQGRCGACWAFAALATIESAHLIKHDHNYSLSEQQLIDCSSTGGYKNNGCDAGYVDVAFQYVEDHGVSQDNDYPYTQKRGECRNVTDLNRVRINYFMTLRNRPASDDDIMQIIYTYGPVVVNIDPYGEEFQLYKSGIISSGNHQMAHTLAVIGWGVQNDTKYWIVKNSWGTTWGEMGFARILRFNNVRNFNQEVYYPIIR